MKHYWQNLNERDRVALVLGIAAVIIYLMYLIIFSPLYTALEQKSLQHKEKRETLAWMKQIRGQKSQLKPQQPLTNTQLLSLLARKLKIPMFQPFPYQLQQLSAGDIQLSFESVPFILFIQWLKQLNQTYAFSIKQFNAQRIDTAGLAKVSLILSAKRP
ncbi:type II secretion system protein GspM [Legionella yabuuchiae]|uniref:type II secretion system protein GspM n=1 Tax=Legionella yabuuchiae TaxID=376727 RepID=UPI0013EFA630|nr:type II secretion system protein GspM [Legionella yabuuchiae]